MSKKAKLFIIESAKGFIMAKSGVQKGKFTKDLTEAKFYDSQLKASNMMKGWSKKAGWGVDCWVGIVEVEVTGKAEGEVAEKTTTARKPATIKKKKTSAKTAKKKGRAKQRA